MRRRLHPTLIDYMVIAINPALIMVLIGSLVYFLLEMYYQGQYPERLHFCLSLFIFGSVLTARISMEHGWEHAAPFGVPLGVVICLAMHHFVSYKGTQLETVGWLVNYGLIALTAWCAYKLTWDCTLMDETQDASGEGLLQTAGLEPQAALSQTERAADRDADSSDPTAPRSDCDEDDDAETLLAADLDSPVSKSLFARSIRYLERHFRRPRRPHAAGLWVVCFSLFALPVFGLGQASIPMEKTGSRRYTFVLLCIYVAAALGLLLTTSFLGLRKYLRQRRLEMPVKMAAMWLIIGTVLIVGLLGLAALLPRSNAEYNVSQLPSALTSENRGSSKVSAGNEGVRDEHASSERGEQSRPDKTDSRAHDDSNSNGGKQPTRQQSGSAKSGTAKSGSSKSESAKSGSAKSDSKSDGGKSDDSKSTRSESGRSASGDSKSSDSKSNESKSSDSSKSDSKSDQAKTSAAKTAEPKADKSASGSGKPSGSKPLEPPGTSPSKMPLVGQMVADLFKWVFYSAIVGLVAWWLLFHWRLLLEWFAALFNGWGDWWGRVFGRRQAGADDAAPIAPRHNRFADYSDPFAAGVAGRYPPAELVRYSFAALEAWGRDNGWPREPDSTVHEFARQIALHVSELGPQARTLADLYSRAAYAPKTLPPSSVECLREFWQALLRVDRSRQPAHATMG